MLFICREVRHMEHLFSDLSQHRLLFFIVMISILLECYPLSVSCVCVCVCGLCGLFSDTHNRNNQKVTVNHTVCTSVDWLLARLLQTLQRCHFSFMPKQINKRNPRNKLFMPFSTAALGIFHFDTCHLLGVKQAGVESRFVRSFCFKTLLRENETSVSFHITAFRCSFFWHSSKRMHSF